MLIDKSGLNIKALTPDLAQIVGNGRNEEGCNVLSEAVVHGHAQVQLRDWLYSLAKTPGSLIRRHLIDQKGQRVEVFVDGIEDAIETDAEPTGMPPDRLTSETVTTNVLAMLELAERIVKERGCGKDNLNNGKVDEVVLTHALLTTADSELTTLLSAWASESGLESFKKYVCSKMEPQKEIEIFKNDEINMALFATSGMTFCNRLIEDAVHLGAKKLTTRHMLYTLMGNESNLLCTALTFNGFDVKKELHAALFLQLKRAEGSGNSKFVISTDHIFEAVVLVFKEAAKLASADMRSKLTEFDICQAFLNKQASELARLSVPGKPVNTAALRAYMESAGFSEEEEQSSLQAQSVSELEKNIKQRIFGQDGAIDRVLPWIKRLKFGFPRDDRPAGVFLFLGPTGTGKTQLAKEIARSVFGDEDMMIYLEMGQFKTKESMNMFIGAPPGYVGYGEGKLTNGLRDKPESVVLFDEIEKADTQVFDTLLRFADEGVISDPAGPVRDGRKCIIVMTTNAGQSKLYDYLRNHPTAREKPEDLSEWQLESAMSELQGKHFRPEFFGRVDEHAVFLPFSQDICCQIVNSILAKELEKFKKMHGVSVELGDGVCLQLAERFYRRSTKEGARGAPRIVNEFIVAPAIDLLIRGKEMGNMPTQLVVSVGKNNMDLEVR